jgi:hypothetical protein
MSALVYVLLCLQHMNTNISLLSDTKWGALTVLVIGLLGCDGGFKAESGGVSGASDSGHRIFSEIAQLSVTCDSTDGGPAACNNSQNGRPLLLAWTSSSCSSISWSSLAAVEKTTLQCLSGTCLATDSVAWRSQSSGAIVYEIGPENRTAVAWLNFVNNGASDQTQPQSGDVVCCQIEVAQNADIHANIQSDKCTLVP